MKIFRSLIDYITDSPESMRLEAARMRVHENLGELRYKTISDSKQEMRGDLLRLSRDFSKATQEASIKYGKESRTE